MRMILLNMVLGSVSFGCVRLSAVHACPEGVPSPSSSQGEWMQSVEGDPNLLWGRSPHLEEARERIPGGRACVRRAGLHVARHAERQTERQTGREPTCSIGFSLYEIAESR